MEITPNSKLYILKDVPLDKTYDHTLYFAKSGTTPQQKAADRATQAAVFADYAKYKFEPQGVNSPLSYIRVNRGTIKINVNAERLYDCNYIMFKNDGFSPDRWFYAFITSIEYINNNTSQITYELDVMQTWYFDYEVEDCFVVREHSSTDVAGDNLLPEGLETGDYYVVREDNSGLFDEWEIAVEYTTEKQTGGFLPEEGGLYGGVFQQLNVVHYGQASGGSFEDQIGLIKTALTQLSILNNVDTVAGIYMLPRCFHNINADDNIYSSILNARLGNKTITNTQSVGSYVPRNKKLLTYPYRFMLCTTYEGQDKEFKYEYFKNGTIKFNFYGCLNAKPSAVAVPVDYQQITTQSTEIENFGESVNLTNFPSCGYTTTDLGAKIVQQAMSLAAISGANPFVSAAVTVAQPKISQPVTQSQNVPLIGAGNTPNYDTVANSNITTKSISSPSYQEMQPLFELGKTLMSSGVRTNIAANSAAYITGNCDFIFRHLAIRREYAEIIDQYFDRYGYACKRVKQPNTHARRHWTYTRTANCTITGSMPADDEEKICNIYNNGITFWNDPAKVGQYTTYAATNVPI